MAVAARTHCPTLSCGPPPAHAQEFAAMQGGCHTHRGWRRRGGSARARMRSRRVAQALVAEAGSQRLRPAPACTPALTPQRVLHQLGQGGHLGAEVGRVARVPQVQLQGRAQGSREERREPGPHSQVPLTPSLHGSAAPRCAPACTRAARPPTCSVRDRPPWAPSQRRKLRARSCCGGADTSPSNARSRHTTALGPCSTRRNARHTSGSTAALQAEGGRARRAVGGCRGTHDRPATRDCNAAASCGHSPGAQVGLGKDGFQNSPRQRVQGEVTGAAAAPLLHAGCGGDLQAAAQGWSAAAAALVGWCRRRRCCSGTHLATHHRRCSVWLPHRRAARR